MTETPSQGTEPAPPPAPALGLRQHLWGRRLRSGIAFSLAALLTLSLGTAGGLISWIWHSEMGTRWLLQQVPGLSVKDTQGSLSDDQFSAGLLRYASDGAELRIEQLQLQGIRWHWSRRADCWLAIELEQAQAAKVSWRSGPATPSSPPPSSMRLPVDLQAPQLRVAHLQVDELPAMEALDASLTLGKNQGQTHLLSLRRLQTDRFEAQGEAQLEADGTLPLQAKLALHSRRTASDWPWQAELNLSGPLANLQAQAWLRGSVAPPRQQAAQQPQARTKKPTQLLAKAQAKAQPKAEPQAQLDLQAELHPFADWPLGELKLRTEALDLAALLSSAPSTRLTIAAQVKSAGMDQAASAQIQLRNELPGRWDEQRLPLRALRASLSGTPQPLTELKLTQLQLEWGTAQVSAGLWRGSGRYLFSQTAGGAGGAGPKADSAQLALQLQHWQPQGLDARLPQLSLSGPVSLSLSALPALLVGAKAPLPPQTPVPPNEPKLALQLQLNSPAPSQALGPTATSPTETRTSGEPVAIKLSAEASTSQLLLRELSLTAHASLLQLNGQVRRTPQARWEWQLGGEARALDLRLWWPGLPGSAWRQQDQLFNAKLESAANIAESALSGPELSWEQRWREWRGHAQLQLHDSRYAGLPLQGQLELQADAQRQQASVDLHSSSAQLQGQWQTQGRLDGQSTAPSVLPSLLRSGHEPSTIPASSQGQVKLSIPELQALAPWLKPLLEGAGLGAAPLAGSLNLSGEVKAPADAPGAWHWHWHGEASAKALALGSLGLEQAQFQGSGGLALEAPLEASLQLRELRQGTARLRRLEAQLTGSPAQHTFKLQAESPLQPPRWLERLAGAAPATGTRARLAGQGKLTQAPEGLLTWAGNFSELWLGSPPAERGASGNRSSAQALASAPAASAIPSDGSLAATAARGGSPWVMLAAPTAAAASATSASPAPPLLATVRWQTDGSLLDATLAPGQFTLIDTPLRWSQVHWQAGAAGQPSEWALSGELPPLAAAPWLARLQPDTAWRGDMQLGGLFTLARHDGRFQANVVLERQSGDLSVDEDSLLATTRRQPLGLSELRLSLVARDGRWQFTQGLAGEHLGALGSIVTVTTRPEATWPEALAPMQGSVSLHVANLGAWATWMPAGWHLGGQLESAARIGGTWGAPEISGTVNGQGLAINNTLEGVALNNGQLSLLLEGPRARLERLTFQTGEGRLSATGSAELGAKPSASIQLQAQRFRALQRIDRQLTLSGQLNLELQREALQLNGSLGVDEGLIDISRGDAPTLPEDVTIVQATRIDTPAARAAEANNGTQRQLAVQLDLGKKLRLKGRGIETGLQGQVQLANTRGGPLEMRGAVQTVGGNYAAYGQKLDIDRGMILFTGPINDPRLDIYAIRPNLDERVGVTITGTALNPRVRLASDTDMSDTEKLSWLVMGRAPEGLGQADIALLQRAALALLMGNGSNPSQNLLDSVGLSDLSVRQATDSNNVQTTVVSVGKQLSRRWYVGYERSVNATAGSWQLVYRVAQRFTLRAQSGEENALDGIWVWRWN